MDEKKTVKNTVSDKKTIGSSHLIRRKPRPSSFHKQINRKTFCERKKFYYLRSGETPPDGMELLWFFTVLREKGIFRCFVPAELTA